VTHPSNISIAHMTSRGVHAGVVKSRLTLVVASASRRRQPLHRMLEESERRSFVLGCVSHVAFLDLDLRKSPIDKQFDPCDVARVVGGEKCHCFGYLLGFAEPAGWNRG